MREIAIVCAGDKFQPDIHVKQIYRRLKKHCKECRLTVFTDQPETIVGWGLPIRALRLPDWQLSGPRSLWWYKIAVFNPEIEWNGPVLYMDLDTAIIDDLDDFFTWNSYRFCICQDFNRAFVKDYPVSNSSVFRFTPGHDTRALYEQFANNRTYWMRKFRGDQDYITDYWKGKPGMSWWPREWAMSYKWEIVHGGSKSGHPNLEFPQDYFQPDEPWVIPNGCKIVVWHGKPDPFDTDLGKSLLL